MDQKPNGGRLRPPFEAAPSAYCFEKNSADPRITAMTC
jgi:hypothetical protein